MKNTDNLRIINLRPLISPALLLDEIPISNAACTTVQQSRRNIIDVLNSNDDRLLIVVGPCSIHDPVAALEYAKRLKQCADRYKDELLIVMRVYFEKPRTTVGWKGLINDPTLNDSFEINQGLRKARKLLLEINELGLPTATEFLDTIIPQYISDLISWSAIGARTTQSQIHRELASGLSMPLGFKNSTTGNVKIAVDAVSAANQPHHFLGVTKQGIAAIVSTAGNEHCHIILRGSNDGPNYDKMSIDNAIELLKSYQLKPQVMVDCSHGNSDKDHSKQLDVINYCCDQIAQGEKKLFSLMIESNLEEGKQTHHATKTLNYSQSITDA